MVLSNIKVEGKMGLKKSEIGSIGESAACEFLQRRGFTVLERNFRRPCGEIDIIARKEGIVHFVEVKSVLISRENISREMMVDPLEHVSASKLKKVVRTAVSYMNGKGYALEYQIDVISVYLDEGRRTARCEMFMQVLS